MRDTKMRVNIMDTLNELMDEISPSKITVTDIANKCGISRQTIYYYFENIDEIVEASYQHQLEQLLEKIRHCRSSKEMMVEVILLAKYKSRLISKAMADKNKMKFDKQTHAIVEEIIKEMIDEKYSSQYSKSEYEKTVSFYSYALSGMLQEVGTGKQEVEEAAEELLRIMGRGFVFRKKNA